jgi:hypothetical protein
MTNSTLMRKGQVARCSNRHETIGVQALRVTLRNPSLPLLFESTSGRVNGVFKIEVMDVKNQSLTVNPDHPHMLGLEENLIVR